MRKTVLFVVALFLFVKAFSQAGKLDSSFGNGGLVNSRNDDRYLDQIVVQPDGKVLAAGVTMDPSLGSEYPFLVRYTTAGKLDSTFSRDGMLVNKSLYMFVPLVAVQPDGKILFACSKGVQRTDTTGDYDIVLIRYQKNGKRDSTFGKNGEVLVDVGEYTADNTYHATGDRPTSIAVESDGRILVATNFFYGLKTDIQGSLIRYNTNGSVENIKRFYTEFKNATPQVSAYADGGYVLSAKKDDGSVFIYSSRFGERTIAHPSGGEKYEHMFITYEHAIFNNGKIAVLSKPFDYPTTVGYIAMLNADGTLDKGFSKDGFLELAYTPTTIAAQPDGKLLIGNYSPISAVWRLNPNGSQDTKFQDYGQGGKWSDELAVYGNRVYSLGRNEKSPGFQQIAAYILSTDPRYVKVNLVGNSDPYNNREWNNWNNLRNLHFNNFYYSDSTISNISAVMSNRNGVNDNGADYGGGMAPSGVLRHSSYAIGSRTITFSGLPTGKKYNIELYASRNAYPTDSTVFSINGVLKKIGSTLR